MSVDILASAAQQGDGDACARLWAAVRRFGYHVAGRYKEAAAANGASDVEDLEQIAAMAMLCALRTWDPQGGAAFLGWYRYYVQRECRAALGLRGRLREEHYRRISISTPVGEEEDCTIEDTLADESIPPVTASIELTELQEAVRAAVDRLPPAEAECVRLHDLQGAPLAALPDGQQLHTRALYHLRKAPRLRIYAPYYTRHKGVAAFNSSWTSEVEAAALDHLKNWHGDAPACPD